MGDSYTSSNQATRIEALLIKSLKAFESCAEALDRIATVMEAEEDRRQARDEEARDA